MKKIIKNPTIISLIVLIAVFLFSRLYNLTLLPIFTDESIYIYWAKVIESSHDQYFISLTDGKPPLLIWMISVFLTILPDSWYLVAGRLPAVIAGLCSLIFINRLTHELFHDTKITITASVLYIIFPFVLLYDRMALFDAPLQAALLASTYFAVRTARYLRWYDAVLWGGALGAAFLSKPTAAVFMVLLPGVVLLMTLTTFTKKWKAIVSLVGLATLVGFGINSMLRLSSVYYLMGRKNAQFQQPIEELIKNPFALTIGNFFHGFLPWMIEYYTVPFFLIAMVGLITLLFKNWRVGIILFVLWLAPILGLATIGREIFPRYMLFTTPYILIAAAAFFGILASVLKKYAVVSLIIAVVVSIPFLKNDYFILTDPTKISVPQADFNQLVGEHPSGYGISEVFAAVNADLATGKSVTVVTQGTFGIYPYAFMLEYWGHDQVKILPRWPLDTIDDEIFQAKEQGSLYIVLKEHDEIPENLPLTLIKKIQKPGGRDPLLLTTLSEEK